MKKHASVALAFVLTLLTGFTLGHFNLLGASRVQAQGRPEEAPGGVKAVREKFERMNVFLAVTIAGYEAGTLSEASVLRNIGSVHLLKAGAMQDFPDVYGAGFLSWHDTFNTLNLQLDTAAFFATEQHFDREQVLLWLKSAKTTKESLERRLPGA